jgi:hypothetical protein
MKKEETCETILRKVRRILNTPEAEEITKHADDTMHRLEVAEGDKTMLPILKGNDVVNLLAKSNFKIAKELFGNELVGGGWFSTGRDFEEYPEIEKWKAAMIVLIRGYLNGEEIEPSAYIKEFLTP